MELRVTVRSVLLLIVTIISTTCQKMRANQHYEEVSSIHPKVGDNLVMKVFCMLSLLENRIQLTFADVFWRVLTFFCVFFFLSVGREGRENKFFLGRKGRDLKIKLILFLTQFFFHKWEFGGIKKDGKIKYFILI